MTDQEAKEKARIIFGRLQRGLDMILEAESVGDKKKVNLLQTLYNRLEDDYLEAKKVYSKTPEDLLRCPDCPHLGEGLLADGLICNSSCREARSKP